MNALSCVHLNADFALGGVTRNLSLFSHPDLRARVASHVVPVDMTRMIAPHYDADVLVNHVSPNWAGLPFLYMLRYRHRRQWLVHVEHSYTRCWEAHNVRDLFRFRTMMKLAYACFDEIVAVSHGQRRWMVEAGLAPEGKIRVIHPFSATRELAQLPAPAFDRARDASRPLQIGAIGRFDRAKGFDRLVRAMGLLPPEKYQLTLAGFGPESEELTRLASGIGHVRFAGRVDDVAAFYARCDVIVVPSRYESFGLVAAEARQAARPVLVANVDGLPEQVVRGGGMVADCTRPGSLARAIEQLADGPLARIGMEGRRSMAGAEAERVGAWLALFDAARGHLAERQQPGTIDATRDLPA